MGAFEEAKEMLALVDRESREAGFASLQRRYGDTEAREAWAAAATDIDEPLWFQTMSCGLTVSLQTSGNIVITTQRNRTTLTNVEEFKALLDQAVTMREVLS